jgi:DNA-binding transcriptional LysR family regulator
MQGIERQIGRVHNLLVFEAAARHLSFSRAAAELGVTQPAVSQGIRNLEDAVGVRLFQRGHRSLALTEAGERLHEEVSDGFARILAVARQIGRKAHPDHVTLLVSTAFATSWMVPRLAEFRAAHPAIDLRLETVDKDIDLASEATTLALRRGMGGWPDYGSALLAPERIVPVASPGFWARYATVTAPVDLLALPLIHLDEPHRFRPGWAELFARHSVGFRDVGDGLRLNDYALVVQAAMAGEGVALGWMHIVERSIAQGLLVPCPEIVLETGAAFHLIWSAKVPLSADAERTRTWITGWARQMFTR